MAVDRNRGCHAWSTIVTTCWFTTFFFVVSTERIPENDDEVTARSLSSVDLGQHLSESEEVIQEHHTFVALIDIVFADTSKRSCTGAIIHDYVVITAAHCFVKGNTKPELTLSFVVKGSKRMFDSGYEQYLPIERYKIHPDFKGWTADLALVYTFTAMTSDKFGKMQQFSHDKNNDPTDTTLTLLSWGQSSEKSKLKLTTKCDKKRQKRTSPYGIHATFLRASTTRINQDDSSRYLSSSSESDQLNQTRRPEGTKNKSKTRHKKTRRVGDPVEALYSNLRRKEGYQQNNLTVETFSIVDFNACKRHVELVMPPVYELKNPNDVVCYTSEEYKITTEDLGAPAIRRGRLLAVTAGAVDVEGQQVAVGIRVACFCPWIEANLPSGGNTMKCCQNCCVNRAPTGKKPRKGPKKQSFR